MLDAIGGVRIKMVGHVIKVDKGIVADAVVRVTVGIDAATVHQWANLATDVLIVGLPRNTRFLHLRDEMFGGALVVLAGRVVIINAKVGAGL